MVKDVPSPGTSVVLFGWAAKTKPAGSVMEPSVRSALPKLKMRNVRVGPVEPTSRLPKSIVELPLSIGPAGFLIVTSMSGAVGGMTGVTTPVMAKLKGSSSVSLLAMEISPDFVPMTACRDG